MPADHRLKKLLADPLVDLPEDLQKKISSSKAYRKEREFIRMQRETDNALQHYFAGLKAELQQFTHQTTPKQDDFNYTFARKTKGRLVDGIFRRTVLLPAAAVLTLVVSVAITMFYSPFGFDNKAARHEMASAKASQQKASEAMLDQSEETASGRAEKPEKIRTVAKERARAKPAKRQAKPKNSNEATLLAAMPKSEFSKSRREAEDSERLAMESPTAARAAKVSPPAVAPAAPSEKTVRSDSDSRAGASASQKAEFKKQADELWKKWQKDPTNDDLKARLRSLLKKIGDKDRLKKLESGKVK